MDTEQAKRFLAAAEQDYTLAVTWYCARVEDEAVDLARLRLLAAQQVLALAQYEVAHAQERGRGREREREREQGRTCAQCGAVGWVHETDTGGDVWLCHGCWERKEGL